ncbi:MAG: hypothetical protein K0R51_442 [Cytophagaceae bacterium]|jgi:hypothetical protein|nr:hypothetical protein [Cytophagaceae bacterium]
MFTPLKKIFCFLLILSLASCASEQEQAGGAEIATLSEADGVTISKGFESATGKASIDYVGVEIINPKSLFGRPMTPPALANVAALTLYRKLSEETKSEKNAIKVEIKSSTATGEQEFTHIVLFKDLKKADQSVKVFNQFSDCVKEEKYEKAYAYLDQTLTDQMPKDTLMIMLQRLSTHPAKIKSHYLSNYEIVQLNENGKETEVMTIEGVYLKDTLASPVKYQLNAKNKIVGFNF